MKSFRFRLFAAVLAVLMGSIIARSQTADTPAPAPRPMHGHQFRMGGGPMMGFFARQLNLTDDQKAQMRAVMQKERPALEPLRQQKQQLDLQLQQYVQGNFDETKVQALANQKAQIDAQLTVQETRIHNQLYQLLTPDQQAQLKQMMANRQARMEQRLKQSPSTPPAQD